jgi:hypothetical protein
MKKRKALNIVSVITQVAQILIFSVIPFLRLQVASYAPYAEKKHPSYDKYTLYTILQICLKELDGKLVALAILMLFNLVLCIIAVSSKKTKKDGIIHTIIPILMLVVNFLCFGEGFIAVYYYDLTMMAPMNIIYWVVNAMLIVLAIAKRSAVVTEASKEKPEEKQEAVEQAPLVAEKSNADEIKKYKELLDMGAITQEEFDEKKKTLLKD